MDDILVAGFDISCNSTGVCLINSKRTIIHAESINPYPLDSVERLNYIYDRFYTILTSYDIKVVGFERQLTQQRYSYSAGSILSLAEVLGVFKLALHKSEPYNHATIYAFKPQVLKQSLSGDAKADKDKMMESLGSRRLKHLQSNVVEYSVNDCADAYAAADAALKVVEGNFDKEYDLLRETENFPKIFDKKEGISIP